MKKLIVIALLCLSAMGMAQELSKDAVIEIGVVGTAKNFRIRTYFGPDEQNPAQDMTWERLSGNRVAFVVVPTQEYMVSKEGFKLGKIKLSPKDPLFSTYGSTFSNYNEFEQWAEDSLGESDGGSPGGSATSFAELDGQILDSQVSETAVTQYKKALTTGFEDNEYVERWDNLFYGDSTLTYIVSGDSTRDVYQQSETFKYYVSQLGKIGVDVVMNAQGGQSGANWAANISNETVQNAIDATPNDGSTTILEYSFGINDNVSTAAELETIIKNGLNTYITAKPKAKIVLVVPVPGFVDGNPEAKNSMLEEAFKNVSEDTGYPLVNIKNIMDQVTGDYDFYYDKVHPGKFGGRRMVNYIIDHVVPSHIVKNITLEEYPSKNYDGTINNLAGTIESGTYGYYSGNPEVNATSRRLAPITVEGGYNVRISHQGNQFKAYSFNNSGELVGNHYFNYKNTDTYGEFTLPEEAVTLHVQLSNDGSTYDALNDTPTVEYSATAVDEVLSIDEINQGFLLQQPKLYEAPESVFISDGSNVSSDSGLKYGYGGVPNSNSHSFWSSSVPNLGITLDHQQIASKSRTGSLQTLYFQSSGTFIQSGNFTVNNDAIFLGNVTGKGIIQSGTTSNRPATPYNGQLYSDTDLGKLILYNGTAWVNVDGTSL